MVISTPTAVVVATVMTMADAVVVQATMLAAVVAVLMTMAITTMTMLTRLVTLRKQVVTATVAAAVAVNRAEAAENYPRQDSLGWGQFIKANTGSP